MSDVTDLIPYADRDPFPMKISDGVRIRKTDTGYVVERLKPDLTWEALDVSGGAVAWGNITGDPANQTDLQTEFDTKEDVENKSTDTALGASDTLYPSQKAVKDYVDAQGGGGSFLSANTARVDPSGDDETGEVGDLNKPFETVQAAVDALIINNGAFSIVQLADNVFSNDVTVDFANAAFQNQDSPRLYFIGQANNMAQLNILTITGLSNRYQFIGLINCIVTSVIGDDNTGSGDVYLVLQESRVTSITAAGDVYVRSDFKNGEVGNITAPNIYLKGIQPRNQHSGLDVSTLTASDSYVGLLYAGVEYHEYDWEINGIFNIVAADADIFLVNSVVKNITCSSGTMIDSRATGTITAGTPLVYNDILLKGVPPGGTTGQALEKASNDDFDTEWASLV